MARDSHGSSVTHPLPRLTSKMTDASPVMADGTQNRKAPPVMAHIGTPAPSPELTHYRAVTLSEGRVIMISSVYSAAEAVSLARSHTDRGRDLDYMVACYSDGSVRRLACVG